MQINRFMLSFEIPKSEREIDFTDTILLIGSCFSNEIGEQFVQSGFNAYTNPFGIAYNPLSIANQLVKSIDLTSSCSIFSSKGKYLDWESAGIYAANTKEDLQVILVETRQLLHDKIIAASCLFITLGSAYAYRLKENNRVVANCHKQPAYLFTKELLEFEVMKDTWVETIQKIKRLNPNITICFTVSPVRHVKDGIIENNRSKARLFELITYLEAIEKITYFPSYEIVVDELRDYRFYKADTIHPSSEAIQYVWERFSQAYFSPSTIELLSKVQAIRKAEQHRFLAADSTESLIHMEETKRKKEELSKLNPSIIW